MFIGQSQSIFHCILQLENNKHVQFARVLRVQKWRLLTSCTFLFKVMQ